MRLTDLLSADSVALCHNSDGAHLDKAAVLKTLAAMLARGSSIDAADVERVLAERERLQSTGIGEGVAIPHGAMPQLDTQHAGLLIVPEGLDFAAIDGLNVNIIFAVIGPKRATGEHLKTLARVSRLLRNRAFRERLIGAPSSRAAYDLIAAEEEEHR
jgi:PTS system nitrogen regulatory IIA component